MNLVSFISILWHTDRDSVCKKKQKQKQKTKQNKTKQNKTKQNKKQKQKQTNKQTKSIVLVLNSCHTVQGKYVVSILIAWATLEKLYCNVSFER